MKLGLKLICILLVMLLLGCWRAVDEDFSGREMASILLERGGIVDVQSFKEKNYIHGLKFFYFHASEYDVYRLISWLGLRKVDGIPTLFYDRFIVALSETNWQFNGASYRVYLMYYCHPFDGGVWSADVLVVSGSDVILISEGHLPSSSIKVDDPLSCNSTKS